MKRILPVLLSVLYTSLVLAQSGPPEINFSHIPVCQGDTAQLRVLVKNIVPLNCGPSTLPPNDSIQSVIVGTGTQSNLNTVYPAPYGNWYKNARHRFLYKASNIHSAGFNGGKINSLAFYISQVSGTSLYKNFRLRLKCTSDSVVDSDFSDTTGFVEVFVPKNVTVYTGWNQHNFDTNFDWDGVSNLYVDVCFDNLSDPTYTYNCSTNYTYMPYPASLWNNSDLDPLCPGTPLGSTSNYLPNIKFTYGGSDFDPSRYTFSYTPSGLLNSNTNQPLALPGGPSSYTVTVTDNSNGLSSTASVNITYSTQFAISYQNTDTLFCIGENPVQLTIDPIGGTWSGNANISNIGVFNPVTAGAGTHNVFYEVGIGTACYDSETIVLEVGQPQDPTISISSPYSLCSNVGLTPIGVVTQGGNWSGSGINPVTGVFNPINVNLGPNMLVYSFSNYCYVSDTLIIDVLASPAFDIDQTSQFCSGQPPVNLTYTNFGSSIYNVLWSGSGITDSIIGTFSPGAAQLGQNMIVMSALELNTNCIGYDTLYIYIYNPSIQILATNDTITQGGSTLLTVVGASTFLWNTGQTSGVLGVAPDTTTTYTVIGTLPNGCSDTTSITIYVLPNTGLADINSGNKIYTLNPSVTNNFALLNITGKQNGVYRLEVLNTVGSVLDQKNLLKGESTQIGDTYPAGIYFVNVWGPDGRKVTKKFVKE